LLQRNEPGWFVGEHIHDWRLFAAADDACFREDTLTALPGERAPTVAASLTRLGEAQPWLGIERTGPLGRVVAAVAIRIAEFGEQLV
jgi:hypothetical protein